MCKNVCKIPTSHEVESICKHSAICRTEKETLFCVSHPVHLKTADEQSGKKRGWLFVGFFFLIIVMGF